MVDANSPARFSRSACLTPCATQKCDEQREEGDSCRTCRRLQLECLGWGPRRPDWMRVRHPPPYPFGVRHDDLLLTHPGVNSTMQDKEAVQAYKTNIKTHLLRLGLIRGQPRTTLSTGTSTRASKLVGTPNTGLINGIAGSERGSFPFPDHQQPEYPFPSGMASIPGKECFTYLCSPSNIGIHVIFPRQCSHPIAFGRVSVLLRNMGTL